MRPALLRGRGNTMKTSLLARLLTMFRRKRAATTVPAQCPESTFPNRILPMRDATTRIRLDIPRLHFKPIPIPPPISCSPLRRRM